MSVEKITDIKMAPDGGAFALVRRRSLLTPSHHWRGDEGDRSDVWVFSVNGESLLRTDGQFKREGYWRPVWSPDGSRLAMMSTEDGNDAQLFVWDRALGSLQQVTTQSVWAYFPEPFAWIDNDQIAAIMLPPGERGVARLEKEPALTAMREWPAAWANTRSTASVLESGIPIDLSRRRQVRFEIIDVRAKTQRILAAATRFRDIHVAPGAKHVAVSALDRVAQPSDTTSLDASYAYGTSGAHDRYRAVVAAVATTSPEGSTTEASRPPAIIPDRFEWSPSGKRFAVLGAADDRSGVFSVFVGAAGGALLSELIPPSAGMKPRAIAWGVNDQLLVLGEHSVTVAGTTRTRSDWFLVDRAGTARNVTADLAVAPLELFSILDSRALVGIGGGDVWRYDLGSLRWTNLTARFQPRISSMAVAPAAAGASENQVAVVATGTTFAPDYYRLHLSSTEIVSLPKPSPVASLEAYSSRKDAAIYGVNEPTGTSVVMSLGGNMRTVVSVNTFLNDVRQADVRAFAYRSLNGDTLKGWMILPTNYQEGIRYPLVSWVYAGSTMTDAPPAASQLNYSSFVNLQLLAARGYAVLIPSIPIEGRSEPYPEMLNGVMPAIDKAIDMGIADPSRLAVMGHSFGGYTTYSLITQTTRFKAAIAMAGLVDLTSLHGSFDPRYRFENPQERLYQQFTLERGQAKMFASPWSALGKYLRNSPSFYVDRIETPVLIIQGDMDYVAMSQGEQMFASLYRRGQRARFVRYWGEGHLLMSPANIRDMWSRIYEWLDELVGKAAIPPPLQGPTPNQ